MRGTKLHVYVARYLGTQSWQATGNDPTFHMHDDALPGLVACAELNLFAADETPSHWNERAKDRLTNVPDRVSRP